MKKPIKYISQKMSRASGMEAWGHLRGFYWHRAREPDIRSLINIDPLKMTKKIVMVNYYHNR